jgi:hypothetical protein
MRCSLRGHSGGCGRGSLDAVPLPLIRAVNAVGRSEGLYSALVHFSMMSFAR